MKLEFREEFRFTNEGRRNYRFTRINIKNNNSLGIKVAIKKLVK